jgi:hypothetical protein
VSGDGDSAASFDGSSGYVAAPALAPLQGGASRSVELWLKTTSASQQPILDTGYVATQGQARTWRTASRTTWW